MNQRRLLDAAPDLIDHLGAEVRSARGAVTVFRPFRFPGPPPEPGVRVPSHPALDRPRWSDGCLELGPWRRNVAPISIACDRHAGGVEQGDARILRPPPVGGVVPAPQGLPVGFAVLT